MTRENEVLPDRITIVPDDYHTPHTGVLADGRLFFATDELLEPVALGVIRAFAAVFVWTADGEFDELHVREVSRPPGYPPMQPIPNDPEALASLLGGFGGHELAPILVAPFAAEWDGVTFGFVAKGEDDDARVELHPGNVLAYYEPWDGLDYDT